MEKQGEEKCIAVFFVSFFDTQIKLCVKKEEILQRIRAVLRCNHQNYCNDFKKLKEVEIW